MSGVYAPEVSVARKILIVMESYHEMSNMESILRKIGIDTMGLQKTLMINEKIVSFAPDIVALQSTGQRINGVELIKKIKRRRGIPKILFLNQHGVSEVPTGGDAAYEMPFDPLSFLDTCGKLLGMNVEPLREKYLKLFSSDSSSQDKSPGQSGARKDNSAGSFYVKTLGGGSNANGNRMSYKDQTKNVSISVKQTVDRNKVQDYVNREKNTVIPNEEDLDESRRDFARSLFKKVSGE